MSLASSLRVSLHPSAIEPIADGIIWPTPQDFLRGRPSKIQSAQQLPQELVDHIIDCSGLVDPCRDLEWNKHLPALHRRELASYTLVSQTWMRSCSKYLLSRIFVNGPPLSSFLAELKTSDRLRWYMTTLVISRTSHPIELNSLIEILALAPNVRNLAIMSIRTDDLLSYDISKPLAHYRMINVALSGPRLSSVPDFLGLFDSIELLRLTDMGRGHDRNHGPEPFLDAVPPAHLDVRDLVLDKCKADLCASLPEILIAGCLRRLTFRTYPFLSITAILACLPQIGQQLTEVTLVCDSTIRESPFAWTVLYAATGSSSDVHPSIGPAVSGPGVASMSAKAGCR